MKWRLSDYLFLAGAVDSLCTGYFLGTGKYVWAGISLVLVFACYYGVSASHKAEQDRIDLERAQKRALFWAEMESSYLEPSAFGESEGED